MSDVPTGSNYETLRAQYLTLLAENKKLREALEAIVHLARTQDEYTASEMCDRARAALNGDTQ